MSQKAKKPRLERSDDSDYTDQEIAIHASYDEEEFTLSSPRSRGDTGNAVDTLGYAHKLVVIALYRCMYLCMCG